MKRTWIAGLLWGVALNGHGVNDWEDQHVIGRNKEAPHATLMPYASQEEAVAADRTASPFYRSLNGTWQFNWVRHPDERPATFYQPDFDAAGWKTIDVPSNVEIEGYGTPIYTNMEYPHVKDPPYLMRDPPRHYTAYLDRNPVRSYRRSFHAPDGWEGRRVFVCFDGAASAFYRG